MPINQTKPGYIVSVPHMAVVVAAFRAVHGDTFKLKYSCLDVGAEHGPAVLGAALFAMNVEAVRQLLGVSEQAPSFRAPVMHLAHQVAPVVAFKAAQCLAYQCNTGTVPRDWRLFCDLTGVVTALALRLAMALPEYERAPWHHDRGLSAVRG